MWNFLKWLLDFDAPHISGIDAVRLSYSGNHLLLLVLAVLLLTGLLLAVVTYMRTAEFVRPRNRVGFGVLRFLGYVCLATALSGSALLLDVTVSEPPAAVVVIDDSLSMSIPLDADSSGAQGPARRIDRVNSLLDDGFAEDLGQHRRLSFRRLSAPSRSKNGPPTVSEPVAPRTDLPATLQAVLDTAADPELAEIILLTDGAGTGTPDYESLNVKLVNRGIKLYPITVTDNDSDLRDVSIRSLRSSPYVRAFDHFAVSYKLSSHGYEQQTAVIEVVNAADPDKVLESRRLDLGDRAEHSGAFILPPFGRAGKLELLVRIRALPGERVLENNQARLAVNVVDEPIKVLYIDNFPRTEFLHTKWSIDRDPTIALTTMNRMPGGGWNVQGSNVLLENPGAGFPDDLGELLKYDVVILGSISRGYFSAGDARFERKLSNLARFVSGRGGGLIVMGGHRSYGQGRYHNSPLAPLLPFELPEYGDSRFLTEDFQAELTGLGQFHPIVQLGSEDRENSQAWQELPALNGCNVVGKPRPGAQVLAVAGAEIDGEKPILIAARQYGYGRVVASTAYAMYLWRLGSPVEEGHDPLKQFWRQAVRYVAPDPRLVADSLNLDLGGRHYAEGETIRVVCRPLNPNYEALANRKIRVEVIRPDGRTSALLLRDNRDEPGTYRGRLTLEQAGTYQIAAHDTQNEKLRDEVELTAAASNEEYLHFGRMDQQLPVAAETSGGRLVGWREAADLPAAMEAAPRKSSRQIAAPLWASPLLMLLLVAVFAFEWFLRKRNSLA